MSKANKTQSIDNSKVREAIAQYPAERAYLIPILQAIQDRLGYLSEDALDQLSQTMDISINEIYGVATFYTQFRFNPPGEHTIRVCQGTACHVRRGQVLCTEIENQLHIKAGQTTADGKFNLERVACLGCCALAPVMVIDDKVYAKMTPKKIGAVLSQYTDRKAQAS
jgi:NADH-quinone oxidoreductase subunit E